MQINQQQRSDQLAKISKNLMLSAPFYGLTLLNLRKQWDERAKTACVGLIGINFQLLVSPTYWDSLEAEVQQSLLQHELLHICLFHLTDFNHLSDHKIANYAMDLELNQYIPTKLGKGWLTLDKFPELQLEPKKGTKYYYDKLIQGKKDGNCPNLDELIANDTNSGMGDPQPGDDKGEPGGKIIITASGTEIMLPDHSSWEELDGLTEEHIKLIGKQCEHIIKSVAQQVEKSRGLIPGEMVEIIKKINYVEPPKFDWRAYLRRFAGGSYRVTTKLTRMKFNKRIIDNPGLKIKFRKHILVGIDTSGSVSTNELHEFMNEIYHISKTGTEVTIIQCDAMIRDIRKFNPNIDIQIHGRGGTSFTPVLEYYNSNLRHYDALIYLTDGEAPAPVAARKRMLWVMSSVSQINESLIGPQIKLN